ncbi:MAG TPA: methionyl-tRNA formyltransferase, partial [Marinagarivorans sp.]
AELGPPALLATLEQLCNGQLQPEQQNDEHANYAHKLSKDEGAIDWRQDTQTILRKIRAFNPFPVAHTQLDGERVRIFAATASEPSVFESAGSQGQPAAAGQIISHAQHCIHIATIDGAIAVNLLQMPGKKALPARDLLNGMADKLAVGAQFGANA